MTDACRRRRFPGTTPSATTLSRALRLNTTAPLGGAGNAGSLGSFACGVVAAGSALALTGALAAPAGPGVRCARTATIATAAAPRASAPIEAMNRAQTRPSGIARSLPRRRSTPARLEERGQPDRQPVEGYEHEHREPGRHRVDSRQQHAQHRHREDPYAPAAAQVCGGDDPQAHEPEHEDRHLEREG